MSKEGFIYVSSPGRTSSETLTVIERAAGDSGRLAGALLGVQGYDPAAHPKRLRVSRYGDPRISGL